MIEELTGKRILVVVAHYDDETIYAGGLLWELREKAKLNIMCCSQRAKARRNFQTAQDGFTTICCKLNGRYSIILGNGGKLDDRPKLDDIQSLVEDEANHFKPDILITHNAKGEYHGHIYHKEVHRACMGLSDRFGSIYVFANGIPYTHRVAYDVDAKKRLMDCYLPWKPGAYRKFVWKKERFAKIK